MNTQTQSYVGDDYTFHAAAGEQILFKDKKGNPISLPRDYVTSAFSSGLDKSESHRQATAVIVALDNSRPLPSYGVYQRAC